jgi:hypothetical protein
MMALHLKPSTLRPHQLECWPYSWQTRYKFRRTYLTCWTLSRPPGAGLNYMQQDSNRYGSHRSLSDAASEWS